MNTSPASRPTRRAQAPSGPAVAMAMADLRHRAQEAAALLKVLANPHRLMLLCHLLGGERPVAGLAAITGITQPTLSQQLGVLRNEGLVAARREGKSVHYRVASPAVRALLRTLYRLYCAPGGAGIH